MNQNTVEVTAKTGLCSSCGMCINICPKGSITWEREKGMYYPFVNNATCIGCGICKKICPGIGFSYGSVSLTEEEAATGNVIASYNAWSKDAEIRHVSASGGVVSTIISQLLTQGSYDVAFCVDSYKYDEQLTTREVRLEDLEKSLKDSTFPKSRYLPISHENAVAYVKNNRDKRVVFIGTSCAVRGFLNVIEHFKLDRSKYLVIGLFCDKVFNYNVNNYYQQDKFTKGKKIEKIHFKNKESGGWPGNMKLMFSDGTSEYLDKEERGKVKEYFMPERCLYCIDKLNIMADISLGDNYTNSNSSKLGSNSVIIRTAQGKSAWEHAKEAMEFCEVDLEEIKKAQYLNGRLNNLYFGILKEKEVGINVNTGIQKTQNPLDYERAWKNQLRMLHAGEVFDQNSQELDKQMVVTEKKKNSKNLGNVLERGYYFIKRRLR